MILKIHRETGHSIRRICSTLSLARISYYHAANPTPRQLSDRELGNQIEDIFLENRGHNGYYRSAQNCTIEAFAPVLTE